MKPLREWTSKSLSAILFFRVHHSVRLNGSSTTRMSIRAPILLVTTSIWPRVASLFKAGAFKELTSSPAKITSIANGKEWFADISTDATLLTKSRTRY